MTIKTFVNILALFLFQICTAQHSEKEYKTWNPALDTLTVIEGQAWPGEVKNYYGHLPAKTGSKIRKPLRNLSGNSTGLQLRFRTNADEINVKYTVSDSLHVPQMPATGVSGVDLYSKTIDGKWIWEAGKFSFGDTIVYRYNNLRID